MFTPANPPLGRQGEFKLPNGAFYSPENQFVHKEENKEGERGKHTASMCFFGGELQFYYNCLKTELL